MKMNLFANISQGFLEGTGSCNGLKVKTNVMYEQELVLASIWPNGK